MTITAKYAGTCATCGGRIRQGDSIEWTKGGGSHHAKCAGSGATARSAPRAHRATVEPPAGPELRSDRAPYTMGAIMAAILRPAEIADCEGRQGVSAIEIEAPAKAKALPVGQRRVAVVVIHTDRMSQENADDNGYCGRYGCVVRLATASEAQPLVAERDQAAQARRWAAWISAWTQIGRQATTDSLRNLVPTDGGRMTADARLVVATRDGSWSTSWYRLPDGSVRCESAGSDDWRSTVWVTPAALLSTVATRSDAGEMPLYKSVDYITKYDGCSGSEMRRARVWLAGLRGEIVIRPAPEMPLAERAVVLETDADVLALAADMGGSQ